MSTIDAAVQVAGGGKIPVQKLSKWVPTASGGFTNRDLWLTEDIGSDDGPKLVDMELKMRIANFLVKGARSTINLYLKDLKEAQAHIKEQEQPIAITKILEHLNKYIANFNFEVVKSSVGYPGSEKYYLTIVFAENRTPVERYDGFGRAVYAPLSEQMLGADSFAFTTGQMGSGGKKARFELPLGRRAHALLAFRAAHTRKTRSKSKSKSKTRSRSKSK